MKDIITIGSALRDVFFEGDFNLVEWPDTPSGKALAFPFGEKQFIDKVLFTIGGSAANTSFTFARQGLKTAVFAKIGHDVSGGEILRVLHGEGISTRLIKTSKLPTSYSALLLKGGERSIITYRGASTDLNLHDIRLKDLKSKWWYASISGDSYKIFSKLLDYAHRNNIKVALNPSDKHLKGVGRRELIGQLKKISFLVVNESEAATITGIPFKKEKEVFAKLDDLVSGIVAVTSGPEGATISDGRYLYKIGVFKNKKVIDRTGAGDAFGSGFVAGLIQKKEKFKDGVCAPENIEYAIRLASANATSVVEHLGATEGALTKRGFGNARFRNLKIIRKEIKK